MTYYFLLSQYKNALERFLKLGEKEISSNDLEYKIAFCCRQMKQYENALIWHKKKLIK